MALRNISSGKGKKNFPASDMRRRQNAIRCCTLCSRILGERHRRAGVGAWESFDDFVGRVEQPLWHIKAERLCGLEVDYELEFRWLFNGYIPRVSAL